jgi:hypothetical protein
MVVLMTLAAMKGDMLIVQGLRPFLVLIVQDDGSREGFRNI